MKQVLKDLRSGETLVVEVPVPTPGKGMVLVQNMASLVSVGTERTLVSFAEKSLLGKARSRPDLVRQLWEKVQREGLLSALETAFNRLDQPISLGYSSAGIVVDVGEGVKEFHPGDRVACAGGGYAVHAEYVVVPRNLVTRLPENVDFESGAFTTVGAIALHGFRLAQAQVGELVAVVGLGLLGLLTAEIANAAGCRVMGIDVNPWRVAKAQSLGINAVVRSTAEAASQSLTQGKGFDAVIICADTSSNDPVGLAGNLARDKGKVVAVGAVGMAIPRKVYYEKELEFIVSRSYGPGRYDPEYEEKGQDYPYGFVRWTEGRNLSAVVQLIAEGRLQVQPLITHRFPIERAEEAYALIRGKTKEPSLGVLITYPQTAGTSMARRILVGLPKGQGRPVEVIRLGVLGAGNYANAVFLPMVQKIGGVEKVGIASASGLHAQHAGRRFGFEYIASGEEEILGDDSINTIAILTRHQDHARQVLLALQRGKHVFCEKPLAIQESEIEQIVQCLREDPGWLLTVGFNRRFAPLARRLREFFQQRSQPLHITYRVNAGRLPLGHWLHDDLQGGGRIVGEGCHFIDFLVYLTDQLPDRVQAFALPDQGIYNEDNVTLVFHFPDGSLGIVSYLANGQKSLPKERVEVFGEEKVAVLDDFRSLTLYSNRGREVYRHYLRQDKGHQDLWRTFLSAIREGGQPPIPYRHLIGVSFAALAARRAIREGGSVEIEVIS